MKKEYCIVFCLLVLACNQGQEAGGVSSSPKTAPQAATKPASAPASGLPSGLDFDQPEAFCNALLQPGQFGDMGLAVYPEWTTEHKRSSKVRNRCSWIGQGRGSGLYVVSFEVECGTRQIDQAFCDREMARFRESEQFKNRAGLGGAAGPVFEEKVPGALCHTLALGIGGDTDFVYLPNDCFFILQDAHVDRIKDEPESLKNERKKQAKLRVATEIATKMQ